jgi:hypothetical protein
MPKAASRKARVRRPIQTVETSIISRPFSTIHQMRLNITLATIIVLMCLGVVVLTTQRCGMAEFSPHSLEYRTRSERTIRFLDVGYRSDWEPTENEVVAMLKEKGWVKPLTPKTDRWETVFHWNEAWRDGDGTLYNVLIRHRQTLIAWSEEHPECAQLYWQEAFRYLRSESEFDHAIAYHILTTCREMQDVDEMRQRFEEIKAGVALDFAVVPLGP